MLTTPLTLLLAAVFAPWLFAGATLLISRRAVAGRTLLTLAGFLVSAASLLIFLRDSPVPAPGALVVGFPLVPSANLDLTFNPDALGLFFGLLISGVGALIVLYARAYFGRDEDSLRRFFPTLGLFATAMLGIVLADNMLAMLLFWELTSLSSFLLIGWERDNPRAVRLALQAFAVTGLGGVALLAGLLMLGVATGEWSLTRAIASVAAGSVEPPRQWMIPWAFGLCFLGGAAKSAQWPFHFWLPGAMAAPTPVSAYLHSATMVKAGVYLFARLYPGFQTLDLWVPLLTFFGAATMLLGAVLALRSAQLKLLFAYTTVSQLGLLTCMYGLGALSARGDAGPNIAWPVTQILSHALYKAPLFIIAGAIIHRAGRRELPECRALLRTHPLLALLCIAGAYAMASGPFTLAFSMKEAFLEQALNAAARGDVYWALVAAALLAAICNVAIFTRIVLTFAAREALPAGDVPGAPNHAPLDGTGDHPHPVERGFWGACIWWPAAALLNVQFVGGAAPHAFGEFVSPVETARGFWPGGIPSTVEAFAHPTPSLYATLAVFALGALLGLSPLLRRPGADPHDALFPAVYTSLQRLGLVVLRATQSGNFRHYVYAVLLALLAGLWAGAIGDRALVFPPEGLPFFSRAPEGLVSAAVSIAALVCLTALALPVVRSRIVRVLLLGGCGFSVTGVYLLYQAPDLAMTQLMFEIISVLIFLLVLRMLPEEPAKRARAGRLGRALFGAVAGTTVAWLVYAIGVQTDLAPGNGALGEWFLANSHDGADGAPTPSGERLPSRGGGGDNAVNVTLVDFRGYDTLGEITVLGVGAMGVLSILSVVGVRRLARPGDHAPARLIDAQGVVFGPQRMLTTPLLHTAMRLILPLALVFAAYVFFKGHDEPGGGFIAGLIAAVALGVNRMSEGPASVRRLHPFTPTRMIALGLGLALTTGVVPLLMGRAFLTSAHAHIPLGAGVSFHWASVMTFDLGIFFVVVGVSLGILHRLTEELE